MLQQSTDRAIRVAIYPSVSHRRSFPALFIPDHIALRSEADRASIHLCISTSSIFLPCDLSYRATIRVNKSCIRATVPYSFLYLSILPLRIWIWTWTFTCSRASERANEQTIPCGSLSIASWPCREHPYIMHRSYIFWAF